MTDGVSTTTRNEAAELHRNFVSHIGIDGIDLVATFDSALATERRLTVERIGPALTAVLMDFGYDVPADRSQLIAARVLDELGEQRP